VVFAILFLAHLFDFLRVALFNRLLHLRLRAVGAWEHAYLFINFGLSVTSHLGGSRSGRNVDKVRMS
jgi:hypothetical protein